MPGITFNPTAIWGKISDAVLKVPRIDPSTHTMQMIDYYHHEEHGGSAYYCDIADTSMASAATFIVAFKTADTTKWPHMTFEYVSKAAAHLDVVEGPTWDASSGTLEPIYNHDRNSGNTSNILEDQSTGSFIANSNMIVNPTTFAGGTIIYDLYTWADKKEGGHRTANQELILKQNTTYGIRVTADASTNAAEILLDWYEHTNKD